MSYKTDRLVDLFPDAYSARDTESLLYKMLDAIGAEFMRADESIKALLKSHWVDYAEGMGLDGLGAIYGVSRRILRGGGLETDDAYRQRLKSVVPLFTGGGTRQAVLGAVRSALGLPFNLDDLNLPDTYQDLRQDMENLIYMEEFSPTGERIINDTVVENNDASELILITDLPTVQEGNPTVHWEFTSGSGRLLTIELLPENPGPQPVGIKSLEDLVVPQDDTLILTSGSDGNLVAYIDLEDVSHLFTNLDDSQPARLPDVPLGRREWRFRSQSALFGIGVFDISDTFELPTFQVEMNWLRYEPLTFDIHVPYFLQQAVADLRVQHNYPNRLFVYEGLPLEAIVDVVDQTRAAGVRGNVHFSLSFFDDHQQDENLVVEGDYTFLDDANVDENVVATSVNDINESHDTTDTFLIGGVFDVSTFDEVHGFSE